MQGTTVLNKVTPESQVFTFPPVNPATGKQFNLDWHQWDVTQARKTHRVRWMCGGIGSGKTWYGCWELWRMMTEVCPGKVGIIGLAEFKQFWEVIEPILRELWPPIWKIRSHRGHGEYLEVDLGGGLKSMAWLRSAHNVAAIRQWDGPTVNWGWMDEPGRMLLGKDAFFKLLGRLRAPGRYRGVWLTGSPKGFNWIPEVFGIKTALPPSAWTHGLTTRTDGGGYYVRACSSKDNHHNPADYYNTLLDAYGGDPRFLAQELNAEIVSHEGLIYPAFTQGAHVIPHKIAMMIFARCRRRHGAIDWGWTAPAAATWGGTTRDGEMVTIGCHYRPETSAEEMGAICGHVQEEHGIDRWWADPESAESIAKLKRGVEWNGKRWILHGVRKANNDWQAGCDSVRWHLGIRSKLDHPARPVGNLVGAPRYYISDRCVPVINEFASYRQIPLEAGKPPREGAVGAAHALDCERYRAHSERLAFGEGKAVTKPWV